MNRFSDVDLMLKKDGSVYHLNLKPGDVANTIILVGDPGRVHRVSRHFDKVTFEMNQREFITHTGTFCEKLITVISTGMGSANVEIVMIELDALFNIDFKKQSPVQSHKKLNLIRIGTSGGMQPEIKLGTELVSRYAVGMGALMSYYELSHDNIETAFADKLKQKFNLDFTPYCVKGSEVLMKQFAFDMKEGNTVTAPGFYVPQGRLTRLPSRYPGWLNDLMYFHEEDIWLTNFDMETAALYAMARMLGHEAISLNAIIANRVKNTLSKNPNKVIDGIISKVLDRL